MPVGSAETSSGPALSMVICWPGWASWAARAASSARALASTSGHWVGAGPGPLERGGDQELVQELLQLLSLAVGDAEQLLPLAGWQRMAVVLHGGQGAPDRGQGPAQLVGDHGQQLLGLVGRGWLAARALVGHRAPSPCRQGAGPGEVGPPVGWSGSVSGWRGWGCGRGGWRSGAG
jgi:hypothetical protein